MKPLPQNSELTLKEQLRQFGLNPQHWRLYQISANKFLIKPSLGIGLSFIGKITKKKSMVTWTDLQWCSF